MTNCREPGPAHPITIAPAGKRVTVRAGGKLIVDTQNALALREANYPPVYYLPRDDADRSVLTRTAHSTHCPYKGDASYYSVPGDKGANAIWTYEDPCPSVAAIKDHLAFYPDRVDSIEVG
jgi:uncharacterized protein (DUF427 family)